mmetsp:Transcript_15116/g.34383  ORF Transcript_15116/g.34383 Transcript_15116/m.34383 type:complete len:313 (-) Transcript_15116:3041-3979(-)
MLSQPLYLTDDAHELRFFQAASTKNDNHRLRVARELFSCFDVTNAVGHEADSLGILMIDKLTDLGDEDATGRSGLIIREVRRNHNASVFCLSQLWCLLHCKALLQQLCCHCFESSSALCSTPRNHRGLLQEVSEGCSNVLPLHPVLSEIAGCGVYVRLRARQLLLRRSDKGRCLHVGYGNMRKHCTCDLACAPWPLQGISRQVHYQAPDLALHSVKQHIQVVQVVGVDEDVYPPPPLQEPHLQESRLGCCMRLVMAQEEVEHRTRHQASPNSTDESNESKKEHKDETRRAQDVYKISLRSVLQVESPAHQGQ